MYSSIIRLHQYLLNRMQYAMTQVAVGHAMCQTQDAVIKGPLISYILFFEASNYPFLKIELRFKVRNYNFLLLFFFFKDNVLRWGWTSPAHCFLAVLFITLTSIQIPFSHSFLLLYIPLIFLSHFFSFVALFGWPSPFWHRRAE